MELWWWNPIPTTELFHYRLLPLRCSCHCEECYSQPYLWDHWESWGWQQDQLVMENSSPYQSLQDDQYTQCQCFDWIRHCWDLT
jgi:hypothetical protein